MEAFSEVEVNHAAHRPSVAGKRHPVICVVHIFNTFGSQPFLLAIAVTETRAVRSMDRCTKTEIGNDQPIAAGRDQYIARADVTMDVIFLVNKGQSADQLVQAVQLGGLLARVLAISPVLKIASAQFER